MKHRAQEKADALVAEAVEKARSLQATAEKESKRIKADAKRAADAEKMQARALIKRESTEAHVLAEEEKALAHAEAQEGAQGEADAPVAEADKKAQLLQATAEKEPERIKVKVGDAVFNDVSTENETTLNSDDSDPSDTLGYFSGASTETEESGVAGQQSSSL
jgi:hypothetical protein